MNSGTWFVVFCFIILFIRIKVKLRHLSPLYYISKTVDKRGIDVKHTGRINVFNKQTVCCQEELHHYNFPQKFSEIVFINIHDNRSLVLIKYF